MSKWLCFGRKKPVVVDSWDCSHMCLSDLPREVWEHRATLRKLNMSSNAVKDIPKTLLQMYRLESIDLSENEILFLPPSVSNMEFLTTLDLSKNNITTIPDAIKDCRSLLTLNLSGNPLIELCPGMMELRQLRKLIINDIQLDELPTDIGRLDKLEILDLRENLLQALPASISHLSLLERLDLGTNEFANLPATIGSLESLSELWLDMNTINILPEEICNLHMLKFMEVSENHLMLLPEGMGGWTSLTHLYLDRNLISLIPPSLTELHNLTILKMDHNRIGGLPDGLDGLSSLSELSLSYNHISELPPSFGEMTNLSHLNMDENILTHLPKEIGQCSILSILSLRSNHLIELPNEISSLSQLSILNISGNQLPHLPYTLNSLNNLTAVWISENQSRPMVDLQLSQDDKGEKCLTCFLFPQQSLEFSEPEDTAEISPLNSITEFDECIDERKANQVNFDPKVQDRPSNKISRDLTPFPKELHNKAMQWRASRNVKAEGGEGCEAVGYMANDRDVPMRYNPKKRRMTNRNSLLTALSEPLDEDNLLPCGSGARRARQKSHSRETTPHLPSTISESELEGAEPESNHVNGCSTQQNHTQCPQKNVLTNPISLVRKISGDDSMSPVLSPDEPESKSPLGHPYQSTHIQLPDSIEGGTENNCSVPSAAVVNNNNNNNKSNMTDPFAITQNSSVEALKVHVLSHSDGGAKRSLLERNPFTISNDLKVTGSGFIAGGEQKNSQLWYTPRKASRKSSTKMQLKKRGSDHFSLLPMSLGQKNGQGQAGEMKLAPGNQMGDYNNNSHQLSQVTLTRPMHIARSPPRGKMEKPYQHCRSHRGQLIGSRGNTETQAQEGTPASSFVTANHYCLEYGLGGVNLTRQNNSYHHHDCILDKRTATGALATHADFTCSPTQPLLLCHAQPSRQKSTKSGCQVTSRLSRDVKPRGSTQNSESAGMNIHSNESIFRQQSLPLLHPVSCAPRHGNSIHDMLINHETESRDKECGLVGVETEPVMVATSQEGRKEDHTHLILQGGVVLSSDRLQVSGRGPVTPTLVIKGQQHCCGSGHDTDFESTELDRESLPSALLTHTASPTPTKGTMMRTVLKKNPSLEIGITRGKDGINTLEPGDEEFHVYEVMDGMPAMKSSTVHMGDRLLEVKGVDVSSLTYHELLALFTAHQKKTRLL